MTTQSLNASLVGLEKGKLAWVATVDSIGMPPRPVQREILEVGTDYYVVDGIRHRRALERVEKHKVFVDPDQCASYCQNMKAGLIP